MKAVGLGLSVPLAYQMSRLAVAAPEGRPTRLLIYFLPHGVPVEHFDVPEGTMDFGASGVGVLSPLEPFKQHVTICRGVTMNDMADNHAAISALLTGFQGGEGVDSIDYTIAKALGTTAHVLGTQPYRAGGAPDHDSQLVKHGSWVTPITNPADAAEELFQSLAPGSDPAPAEPTVSEADFRNEALALTEGELEQMQQALSGLTAEQNKLQLHLEAIRELKAQSEGSGSLVTTCDVRPSMPAAEAMVGKDPFAHANFADVHNGHLQVAANALVCGTARVATIHTMYANAQITMDFPGGPGYAKNHHDPLSHSADDAGRTEFAEVQKWFYQQVADHLLATLDQPDPADPGHTVLDNTVVFMCSEVSDGQLHNSQMKEIWLNGVPRWSYPPFLLIGGGGGYLKTNQVAHTEVMHTDILATLAAAMGVPIQTIGGQNVSVPSELQA